MKSEEPDGRKHVDGSLETLDARIARLDARIKKDVEVPVGRMTQLLAKLERGPGRLRPMDAKFVSLADELVTSGRTLLSHDRLYTLWQAARNVAHLGLPAVEVGVYRGGTTAFMARALADSGAPDVAVYAFDTFTGHPVEAITEFDPHHAAGHFADTSFGDVQKFLSAYPRVEVRQGAFPEAAAQLPTGQFCLAHLDTDLYGPTLGSLRLLAERMPAGAVMVVDDYGSDKTGGVLKAVREFLADRAPFQQWDLGTQQAVLVRR